MNRTDFGVNFNAALDTGGVAVGEKVKLELDVEALEQPLEAAATPVAVEAAKPGASAQPSTR